MLWIHPSAHRFLAICFCLFSGSALASNNLDYAVKSTPAWVTQLHIDDLNHTQTGTESHSVRYLLVDRQLRFVDAEHVRYSHYISQAMNTTGVSEVSQISIEFDPTYERLELHQLTLHRNGEALDRLGRSRISLLQREEELAYQIYDGTQTLNIFIEDVRVGDTIEYSYSIVGNNPVFTGHTSQSFQLQWNVPVSKAHYRVLWPTHKPLTITPQNTQQSFTKIAQSDQDVYHWEARNLDALIEDANTPNWFQPYPVIRLTDFQSWAEVAQWAAPLYSAPSSQRQLTPLLRKIIRGYTTQEDRALAALKFVQDEIRYLGIEMGPRSHRPNSPDQVITQRFGDCKDKSRLLIELLTGLGIRAYPAWVHTTRGKQLVDHPPSATAFDHSIVKMVLFGKTYWLDPTRTHQADTLSAIYQPNYDYALVLANDTVELSPMLEAGSDHHRLHVEEFFDISAANATPASYYVVTHYYDWYADDFRARLASTNTPELQRHYLNYLAKYYPTIEAAGALEIEDDKSTNHITTKEHYWIPNLWTTADDKVTLYASFEPYQINENLTRIATPIRTMPYAVKHPLRHQQTTTIRLPAGGEFERESRRIEDPAFTLAKTVRYANNILTLDYIYTTHADSIAASETQTYGKNIREANENAYYQIRWRDPSIDFTSHGITKDDLNWPAILMFTAAVAVLIGLAIALYRYDPATHLQSTESQNPALIGLSGWLVLVALGLFIAPFRILTSMHAHLYLLSSKKWTVVAQELGEFAPYLDLSSAVMNLGLGIFASTLLLLFFQKRWTFPRFYITYLLAFPVINAAYLAIWQSTGIESMAATAKEIGQLIGMVIGAAIWVTYTLRSKRVRATFTKPRSAPVSRGGPAFNHGAVAPSAAANAGQENGNDLMR